MMLNSRMSTASRPSLSTFSVLAALWPYVKPYRWRLYGALLALTCAAALVLGLGRGLRAVIDYGFAPGNIEQSAHWLNLSLLGMLVIVAGLALATYSRFYLVSTLGERVVADLREALFRHLLTLDISYYETARTGEIVSRLTSDATLLQTVVGSSASMALRNILLLIGGMIMLFLTSAKLTLLVLIGTPLVIVPILVYARRTRHLARESQDRIADVAAELSETIDGMRTVQAFTAERMAEAAFTRESTGAYNAARARIKSRAILTAFVILLVFSAIGVILWLGGHDVLAGRLTGGQLSAFVFYAVIVASGAAAISEVMADLERAAGATDRIFELLAIKPSITAPANPRLLPTQNSGRIIFDKVNFAYPAALNVPVLKDIDFTIEPGQRVAIVGPSGAGKSTLFQLLLRFHDPLAGSISLDGIDLRSLDPAALRQRFGFVAQEPALFRASAADNIRFGRPDATIDEIRDAARTANALEFIERLPQGFDTPLGEKGVRLSGGQRQRLALARAILRNPVVLLLDEATSALDAESEQLVQQALEQVMPGRTTLIIAHRLATVQSADRILVIERGQLVEDGTHASLTAAGGLYARLAALQFRPESI